MTITYPLSIPTNRGVQSVTLRGGSVTANSVSPFTLQDQIQVFPGQQWSGTVTLPPMHRDDAEYWNSFLLSLNGKEGYFLLGDPAAATPRGSIGGTPLVNGGSQSGKYLQIDGCSHSITQWLKAGDYVGLITGGKYRLHKALQDVSTDSSGNAIIPIWPNLRESPADNQAVVVSGALGQFRLQNSYTEWSIDQASVYSQSFAIVETI